MQPQKIELGSITATCLQDNSGATAVEYGLLIGLVAVGLAGGLGALADLVNLLFDMVSTDVSTISADVQTTGGGTSG